MRGDDLLLPATQPIIQSFQVTTMSGEGINPALAETQSNIAQELMEEDLKRELARNELATRMALAKEAEAHEAKRRYNVKFICVWHIFWGTPCRMFLFQGSKCTSYDE